MSVISRIDSAGGFSPRQNGSVLLGDDVAWIGHGHHQLFVIRGKTQLTAKIQFNASWSLGIGQFGLRHRVALDAVQGNEGLASVLNLSPRETETLTVLRSRRDQTCEGSKGGNENWNGSGFHDGNRGRSNEGSLLKR